MWQLPIDKRGYPVPWFVAWFNGEPDFRIVDTPKWGRAVRDRLCWVCGEKLGRWKTFVSGPMCVVTGTSAEPPSHYECATFAAKACPFLTLPKAVRREANLPSGMVEPPGMMNERNPGVVALLTSRSMYTAFRDPGWDGTRGREWLLQMPDDAVVDWLCEGRLAKRAEVLASIDSGMPALRALADVDNSHADLDHYYQAVLAKLPKE